MARSTPEPPEGDPVDLEDKTKADLEAEAARVGANPEGSGKGGRVLKDDLIEAIASTPGPPVGRPPLAMVAESAVPRIPNLTDSEV